MIATLWTVLHRIHGCGRPAFHLTRLPREGEIISGLVHLNGTPFIADCGEGVAGEFIRCDSCGRGGIALTDLYGASPGTIRRPS